MRKQEKGITLIALVVTIVVLLILAGVSISMLGGENGIITQAQNAKEETEKSTAKEELEIAQTTMMLEYYNGNIDIFNKDVVMENFNKYLSENKIEKATIHYDINLVNEEKINELETIYKYKIGEENVYFTISEEGKLNYLETVNQLIQEYDENGISKQAGKWISYPASYTNQSKDYDMNGKLNGWRILNNDNEYAKIVTAGIPARYEYNHNKTIVDDWNNFTKFENTTFTWGISNIKQLKDENLAIGIRSINYKDITEVTSDMGYFPTYSNSIWGNNKWPTRLRGLIGCGNEYIVATWQNQASDSLYYMTFPIDQYGMGLNSNGYLYYPGVRVVAYLNKNVHVYETEYFDGSSNSQPLLLVY